MASTDRDVLLVLYRSTDGPNWRKKNNWGKKTFWGSDVPLSRWHGVTVNGQGRVVKLDLSGNNLRGSIPPELGALSKLLELWLSDNYLSGPIPAALGALSKLKTLWLNNNQLTGPIPKELGNLSELKELYLYRNQLTGRIPKELGNLSELKELYLFGNQLTGPIPPELGNLRELRTLLFYENQLTGHIPKELGALSELRNLQLWNNELTGAIPAQLGDLNNLTGLDLSDNQLNGTIPPELGKLAALQTLSLISNNLTGPIPPELGNLRELTDLRLHNNQLTGGREENESLRAWQSRLRSELVEQEPAEQERAEQSGAEQERAEQSRAEQERAEQERAEQERAEQERAEQERAEQERAEQERVEQERVEQERTEQERAEQERAEQERAEQERAEQSRMEQERAEQERAEQERAEQERAEQERAEQERAEQSAEDRAGLERGGTDVAPVGRSSSPGGGGEEDRFRVQVASFAGLKELTKENRETLEEVKRLLGQPAVADTLPSGAEFTYQQLGELDSLIGMAKTLDEMTSRYSADLDIERKEMSLDPGRKAYNVAVRSGLCNAYLAASVVCSGLVSTSKVGIMGKAGAALKLISGAVPLVGGLAGFAGAALEAGDSIIQTRRLEKITDLAPDAVECSTLARSLALRLTDGLTDGIITYDANEHLTRHTAGVGWGAGGSKTSQGSGALTDGVSEEAVIEWFVDGISDYETGDCEATTETRDSQAGKRLGRRHLRMLLTAVGRDCLQGTNNTKEKVDTLLQVILREVNTRPTATLSAGEDPRMRPPTWAPAEAPVLARLEARLEKQQAQIEALKLENKKLRETPVLARLEARTEKQQAQIEALKLENKKLRETVEKCLPKPHAAPDGSVDVGGGLVFAQEQQQKTETQEEFNERMENPARAADRQTVTPGELRILQGHLEELGRETGHLGAQIAALQENRGKKKGLRRPWHGNH